MDRILQRFFGVVVGWGDLLCKEAPFSINRCNKLGSVDDPKKLLQSFCFFLELSPTRNFSNVVRGIVSSTVD